MRMNRQVKELLSVVGLDALAVDVTLTSGLVQLLSSPIHQTKGCLVLSALRGSPVSSLVPIQDKTGYESTTNSIHIVDILYPHDMWPRKVDRCLILQQALMYTSLLAKRLESMKLADRLRVLMSYDANADASTVRFFTLRDDDRMGTDDIDQFEQPILVRDV